MGLFHSRDVEIKLQATVSINETDSLDTFFGSATDVVTAKSWEISYGERDFDQTMYHGQTASGYQNQGKTHKPTGPAMLKMTLDADSLRVVMGLVHDSSTAISTTHTRLANGDAAWKEVAILSVLDDGTDELLFAMDKAELVGSPTVKTTGADGAVEWEVEFKCLNKDFYGPEFSGQ